MHKHKAIVGDIVRSYDFKPMADRGDSYIEGIVIEKTNSTYSIAVQKRVFAGEVEPVEVGEYVVTHFKQTFMEYEGRITKLSRDGVAAQAGRPFSLGGPLRPPAMMYTGAAPKKRGSATCSTTDCRP